MSSEDQQEKLLRLEKAEREAIQDIFKGEQGQIALRALARHCNVNETSHIDYGDGRPSDPYQTYYNEGKRAVFLYIVWILNTNMDKQYSQILEAIQLGEEEEDF